MSSFVKELAQTLLRRHNNDLSNLVMVFPSLRARVFFCEALTNFTDAPLWQPSWSSIDELMERGSGLVRGERIRLISELYKVYKKHHPSEKFDQFYFWGEILLNDFDLIDVMQIRSNGDDIFCTADDPNAWKRDKAKGKAVLVAERYPTRNYTTHLPQWYDWDKLAALWDKYDMDNESYLMEDLYYNIYYQHNRPENVNNIDNDRIKCGVYRSNPRLEYIERAFSEKLWITNSPEGWIPFLEDKLAEHYGL